MRAWVREPVAVFAGGCLGALARAGLAEALPPGAGGWPWGTFVANLAASFMLGWVAATFHRGRRRAFLATGVCGALSTFSTFQLELLELLDRGRGDVAAIYAALSLLLGLYAVLLGRRLGVGR